MNSNTTMMAVGILVAGYAASWVYQTMTSGSSKQQEEELRKKRLAKLQQEEEERKRKEEEESGGKPRLLCYFGSQTGTAEGFAKQIADVAKRHGFASKVLDLDEFDSDAFEQLAETKGDKTIVCFTVATYGEGDPSDNAVQFANYLKDESAEARKPLGGLRFCVFGLGNRQYEQFNAMGKLVDSKLEAFGARRIYKYGEGDDDGTLQEDFNAWFEDLILALRIEQFGANSIEDDSASQELTKPEFAYDLKWLKEAPKGDERLVRSGGRFVESERKVEAGKLDFASKAYFRTEAFEVKMIRELRRGGEGSTLHVELELPASVRSYGTAFNLSILPENDPEMVVRCAKALRIESRLDDWLSLRPKKDIGTEGAGPLIPSPCTLRVALATTCALNTVPTKGLIEKLAYFARDPSHQQEMKQMCAKDGKQMLHDTVVEPRMNLVELLERFPSISFDDAGEFIELCPRLAARDYTIASSSKENPRVVALTISLVTERLPGNNRTFKGVCTWALKRRKDALDRGESCEPVYAFVKPSSFVLPADPLIPVVFVGPGTGVAPMRALMQERRWLKDHGGARLGPGLLFFGCRRKDEDYIYDTEYDQFKKSGVISNYFVAFSRETSAKVYVQELVKQQGDIIWDWMNTKKAHVYVCGGTLMGKDVYHSLISIASKAGKLTEVQAKDFVQRMSNEGRLVQELWS